MIRVFIAAGGTGGHIFPALAVADSMRKRHPLLEVIFLGSKGGMEERVIPTHGYKLMTFNIGRLNKNVSLLERLTTLVKLPLAIIKGVYWSVKYKPDLVMGFGGHASAPALLGGLLAGRKCVIWEPNAIPGMANRLLSWVINNAYVVFDEAKKHLRSKHVFKSGIPVRAAIEKPMPAENGIESAGRSIIEGIFDRKIHVFVFGGSQGARPINMVVSRTLVEYPDLHKHFEFIHQTGSLDQKSIQLYYKENGVPIEALSFIDKMEEKYAWADFVVSRSGTGTISELSATSLPCCLIPLPTAADDHQRKNAEAFAQKNAAIMILQKDFTSQKFYETLMDIKENPKKLSQMSQAIKGFHQPKASDRLADKLLEFMNTGVFS
jgi:UDP-N-acetylglucosamine--N-acetylmuramyl-(pentapeptide) pyrophosphoryl-undecaprenol N-acetylglucosamine transferase